MVHTLIHTHIHTHIYTHTCSTNNVKGWLNKGAFLIWGVLASCFAKLACERASERECVCVCVCVCVCLFVAVIQPHLLVFPPQLYMTLFFSELPRLVVKALQVHTHAICFQLTLSLTLSHTHTHMHTLLQGSAV